MYINKILMNYFKSNFKISLLLFLIIPIVLLLLEKMNNIKKDGFTTGIREMYRPYTRNIRLIYDNYYNKVKTDTQLIFRKFGLF
jgi:hypothetical protein